MARWCGLVVALLAACAVVHVAGDDTCAAGADCGAPLLLNTTVFMAEMSWYEYARRVASGVTVIVPVGSTEQARRRVRMTRRRVRITLAFPSPFTLTTSRHTSTARTCPWAWTRT